MTDTDIRQIFRERGASTIATGEPTGTPIPLDLDGIVFKQMFEYAVVDFGAEVGFFSEVFGFSSIAMTSDYALFTPPTGDFHFSIRLADGEHPVSSFEGFKLLFMTGDFDTAESHIRDGGLVRDAEVRKGSPSQRVLHFASPSGLPIEIWEDPTPKQASGAGDGSQAGALSEYATDEPLQWDRDELWAEIAEERDNRVLQQIKEPPDG